VQRPQRRNDDVIPALVCAGSPLPGHIRTGADPDLRAAHRLVSRSGLGRKILAMLMRGVLRGAPGPSRRTESTERITEIANLPEAEILGGSA
jgi:hypothetical protein